jgi:hypothetical protein
VFIYNVPIPDDPPNVGTAVGLLAPCSSTTIDAVAGLVSLAIFGIFVDGSMYNEICDESGRFVLSLDEISKLPVIFKSPT